MKIKILLFLMLISLSTGGILFAQYTKINYSKTNQKITTPDPQQLLKKAAEACLKVKTAEYTYVRENVGGNGMFPPMTAKLWQERADVPEVWMDGKFRASGQFQKDNTAQNFAFAYDGNIFRYLDVSGNIANVMKSPTQKGVGSLLAGVGLGIYTFPEFTDPEPLKDEIEGPGDWSYIGTEKVEGVSCHVILKTVKRSQETPRGNIETLSKTYFYLGEDDFLPRRYLHDFSGARMSMKTQMTAKDLVINKGFNDDTFLIETPTGFVERLVTEKEATSRNLLQAGSIAPDWKLTDSKGTEQSLSGYRGKIVIMDFWATWCGPCIKSMPEMQKLYERFKDRGVVVLGINTSDDAKLAADFMKKKGYTYPLLANGEKLTDYNPVALPTLYIIGSNGQIVHSEVGYRTGNFESFSEMIENLLKNKK